MKAYIVNGGNAYTLQAGCLFTAPVYNDGSVKLDLLPSENGDWTEVQFDCISANEKQDCLKIRAALSSADAATNSSPEIIYYDSGIAYRLRVGELESTPWPMKERVPADWTGWGKLNTTRFSEARQEYLSDVKEILTSWEARR